MQGTGDAPLLDPRQGDVEDDASSPKQRSLLAIAGSLLAEISLPKLAFAWTFSILVPALLLGAAPLVATAWLLKVSNAVAELTGLGAVLILLAIVGLASSVGGRFYERRRSIFGRSTRSPYSRATCSAAKRCAT